MSPLIDPLGFLFVGAAILTHAFIVAGGSPAHRRHHQGQENDMAVSQDIQDFCTALPTRVQATIDQAVSAALASAKTDHDQMVQSIQQDHADEVAALKAALDQAAPSVST